MSMPDYTDEQLATRSDMRERFAPGTRVRHVFTDGTEGTIAKLHTGTLKRPRPVGRWTATVTWDTGRPGTHALDLLRAEEQAAARETACIRRTCFGGQEEVTMTAFESMIIQDDDEALKIARRMLDGIDPYPFNEAADDPCFYEEFSVFDVSELRRQVSTREAIDTVDAPDDPNPNGYSADDPEVDPYGQPYDTAPLA